MARRSTVPSFVRKRREAAGLPSTPSTPRTAAGQSGSAASGKVDVATGKTIATGGKTLVDSAMETKTEKVAIPVASQAPQTSIQRQIQAQTSPRFTDSLGGGMSIDPRLTQQPRRQTFFKASGVEEARRVFKGKGKPIKPKGIERLVPSLLSGRIKFEKERGAERALEERKLTGISEKVGEFVVGVEERKLKQRQKEAQKRIDLLGKQLQAEVSSEKIRLPAAEQKLSAAMGLERTKLTTEQEAATKRAKARITGLEPALERESIEAAARLQQKRLDASISGTGKFGLEELAARKIPGVRQAVTSISKAQKKFPDIIKRVAGIKTKDVKAPILSTVVKGGALALKVSKPGAGVAKGLIRRPLTTTAIAGLSFATLGASSLVAPSLKVAAATGSKLATATLRAGKVASILIGTGFVGATAIRVTEQKDLTKVPLVGGVLSPFGAPTREEAEARAGESIALVVGGVAGGVAGTKAGSKLFEAGLARRPTVTRARITEIVKGKDQFIIRTEGITSRGKGGKFKFDFRTEEALAFKGQRFVRTTKTFPRFLGKELPTIKSILRGRAQEAVQPIPGGPQQFISGTLRVGKGAKQPVDFEVFRSGEIIGTIGKTGFKTQVTDIPKVLKGVTTFKIKEVTIPSKLKLKIKFPKIPKFGKRGSLSVIPKPGGDLGDLIGRVGIERTFKLPKASIPGVRSTVTPAIIPEAGLLLPTVTKGVVLFPPIPGASVKGGSVIRSKLDSITSSKLSISNIISSALTVPSSLVGSVSPVVSIPNVGAITAADTKPFSNITPRLGFTTPISPRIPPPPIVIIPFLPLLGGGGGGSLFGRKKRIKRLTKFQPSIVGVVQKRKKIARNFLTGFEVRGLQQLTNGGVRNGLRSI